MNNGRKRLLSLLLAAVMLLSLCPVTALAEEEGENTEAEAVTEELAAAEELIEELPPEEAILDEEETVPEEAEEIVTVGENAPMLLAAASVIASGSCGENLTWTLDNVGTLTISGTGAIRGSGSPGPWYSHRREIKTVQIESGVTSIGDDAFIDCDSLTSITIPNSVTSIGDYAFVSCSRLTSITIPNSVTSIGIWAFGYCDNLTSITIPNSVTSIGNNAFVSCSRLTSITIPNSVTSIGNSAFRYCSRLTSITIPNSVTSIGYEAFYYCTALTDIYYTGTEAQWNAISIGSDAIPDGVTIHYNSVSDTPQPTETKTDYVAQMYAVCLGREPGADEIAYYLWEIDANGMTGTELAYRFIFSDEFLVKNYCDHHYAEALYKAFMGRAPGDAEIESKVYLLQQGQTREQVFNEFVTSSEYKAICDAAGIVPGSAISYSGKGTRAGGRCTVDGCHSADGMDSFNARLYSVVLDRQPAQNELDAWAYYLIHGEQTAKSAAKSFLFSEEFQAHGYDDAQFVSYLYEAMMGRTPGSDEVDYWVWMLSSQGLTREAAFEQFAASDEFMVICAGYGIVCE